MRHITGFIGSATLQAAWERLLEVPEEAPPDYLTADQLMALLGMSRRTVLRRVARAKAAGRLRQGWRRTLDHAGRLSWRPAYLMMERPQ